MQRFTIEEVQKACGGKLLTEGTGEIKSVCIDSRKVTEGSLFVAIPGEKVDGHDYVEQAFAKGAVCAVVQNGKAYSGGAVIGVEDSARAIGDIAKAYKEKYNVPTVSVTGSVGKTTTKDMIASVMAKMAPCLKTEGNFNNELGLPLTIFNLNETHKSAVLEMGMSAFGEIEYLVNIARPDVAVISNIGVSHIENLGSREGILQAKMEICTYFGKDNLLIINADNDMLKRVDKNKEYKVVTYGIDDGDFRAKEIKDLGFDGSEFVAEFEGSRLKVRLKTPGIHNVYNALSAIAVGVHFGISDEDICDALENYSPTAMRMDIIETKGVKIINDCYNASPDSVRASLAVLAKAEGRKVAFLGDVLELGDFAMEAHYGMGRMCEDKVDSLICVGDNARHIAEGAKAVGVAEIKYYPRIEDAIADLKGLICDGDTILVKASRGMAFEKITKAIGER